MPSRKDIQWSQLKVGALVLLAMAALVFVIFRMGEVSGGFFTHKIDLICYFKNAAGLAPGAPVMLEGVTIGNVTRIRVVSNHGANPVEVVMRVNTQYLYGLHTDSVATITQAGVLGNSFVDIDSTEATGPSPANGAVLQASGTPTLQDVIGSSNAGINQIRDLTKKLEITVDRLNSNRGTVGRLINDRQMANKLNRTADNLEAITSDLRDGKGTAGKLLTDQALYDHLDAAVNHLNNVSSALDSGQGTLGKLLHDDTLYNNLNDTVKQTHALLKQINEGKGAIGKLTNDPVLAHKLDDAITHLDNITADLDAGKGTAGQLLKNRSLYDHLDQTSVEARDLIKGIRENPKKYLIIRLKLF